jgi:hypothetical protein
MSTSQNGWPVITDAHRDKLTDRAVLGAPFPHGWLKGDVDVIFTDLITRLDAEVEGIDTRGCWGWFVKPIEGSATVSNHSSGTAIDYNAPAHPMGQDNTYNAADRARIRTILRDYSGVVRWGGDYTGRPDDMHFEINANAAAVRTVADRIRKQGDDMTQAEFNTLMTSWATSEAGKDALASVLKRDNIIKAPAGATNADGTPNEYVSAATVLAAVYAKTVAPQA